MSYRTAPLATPAMPPGIPFIVGNEAAERFSFYGMRGILIPFMTGHLLASSGAVHVMDESEAKVWFHMFVWAVYLTPLAGAILADRWLGKYRTIILLSLVYCLGHVALAIDVTRAGLLTGLLLISLGSGGIKGCVSAHVGDQFGNTNAGLLPRVYSWFYFSINFGSFFAFLTIPWILKEHGPHWAFGIPGILMAVATLVFWMGRHRYAHVPPKGPAFWGETFSREGLRAAGRMVTIFVFIAMFWSLFDQTSSQWVLQADHLNRSILGYTPTPAMFQAVNPAFVLLLIPLFSYVIYPAVNRVWTLTPLRKISLGFFVAVPSFLIPAWLEYRITAGEYPSVGWQVLAYLFITMAEIMISITALEFSYTQAPRSGKSLMFGLNFASVSLGNLFTAIVNLLAPGSLTGVGYYLFFAGCMTAAAVLFIPVAARFRPRDILQDEVPGPAAAA